MHILPEANEYGLDWNTKRVTDEWYNAGLFDNQTGKAMQSLYELKTFLGSSAGITSTPTIQYPTPSVYTLDGRRVSSIEQAPSGIYIIGNKKVIKK